MVSKFPEGLLASENQLTNQNMCENQKYASPVNRYTR